MRNDTERLKSKEERLKDKLERIETMFPDPTPAEARQIARAKERVEKQLAELQKEAPEDQDQEQEQEEQNK